ncbi:MAG: sulfurtransferase [Acidimicrobiales bacterium]|jgi:thiosulfate/3-mercaptopyruvate sulfurtransferase
MLIEAVDLLRLIEAGAPLVILDVRWSLGGPPGRGDYETSHIVGAGFVDLDRDLSAPPGMRGRHPLPAAPDFAAAMRRLGVRASVPVVVYDAGDSVSAARCSWLLGYFGHDAVSILNGGLAAWSVLGGPTEAGSGQEPTAGDFDPVPGHRPLLDADGAAALARSGVLLDARPSPRYRGEVEPIDAVAGHIPGARSAPTADNLEADGRWRSPEVLRERFARLGVVPPAAPEAAAGGASGGATLGRQPAVGAYCGSGITAAHEVFALELAGIEAALYVGSWSEWSRDASRPVATGPEPG